MAIIDKNEGSSTAPISETAGAFKTTNVTVIKDASTPAGEAPTVYLSADAVLFGTVNISAQNGAVVYVSEPVNLLGTVNLYADGGTIDLGATGLSVFGKTTGIIENGGTLIESGDTAIGLLDSGGVSFGPGGGVLEISSNDAGIHFSAPEAISGFQTGDNVIDGDFQYSSVATYVIVDKGPNQVVTFKDSNGHTLGNLTFSKGTFPTIGTFNSGSGPLQLVAGPNGSLELGVCFLAGTNIATPAGETIVEDLRSGDVVKTLVDGKIVMKHVKWIGHRSVFVTSNATIDAYPIRIRAGAIALNIPHRDLLVTSDHCIFLDGKLIPSRMLVNDRSIIADRSIKHYTYYHVELEEHGILLAEGLTTESYLDTGNRGKFVNATVVSIAPPFALNTLNQSWANAAAPLTVDQTIVEPIWRQLDGRAQELGIARGSARPESCNNPDLHLIASNGATIRPIRYAAGRYMFMLPGGDAEFQLMSRSARPSDTIGPYIDDRRELGVLVGEVALYEGRRKSVIVSHLAETDLAGWHGMENTAHRWTNGKARLSLARRVNPALGAILEIQVVHAGPYPVTDRIENAAFAA